MKIIVTGSTGLIGSALVQSLTAEGHEVTRLVRGESSMDANNDVRVAQWDLAKGKVDAAKLEGHTAVVHLAGESVAQGRWTPEKKARIRDSRVQGTGLLAETLKSLAQPPSTLVCASAIGYYGNRGDEVLREESPAGTDFLAGVCREWEAAAAPAAVVGVRIVHLRIGIVLSPAGGALAKLLTAFKMGAGGKVGSGKQYMSWIALDDVIGAIYHALRTEDLAGPVNTVAPHPVMNGEFTGTLGRVLDRPTVFSVPAFAARLAFGEMADALLLSSARVEPTRLLTTNYRFLYPELEAALRYLLGK